ncbi:hypothetical protein [Micromonospora chalcea]|uniref:hypothetical protein n=1 Tax=Micromonospora chalcea TaxID=1874 RepID=UPI003410C1C3
MAGDSGSPVPTAGHPNQHDDKGSKRKAGHEVPHHIRAARWREQDIVATVIAEALQPTPIAAWLIPDHEQRGRVLADVAAIWVEHAMFYGDVHITSDLTAVTICFHQYGPVPPPADYPTRLATAAGPHAERFRLLDNIWTVGNRLRRTTTSPSWPCAPRTSGPAGAER